ncbi:hypothetical protein KU306_02510 [Haloferax larsenii]|uniref:Envelope protein N-terminal domain-containing protein n=1 Tax=Haloferax larsenii TaxID=302484 RepID=A0ABY5REN0_HALLR|nr:hypothetical protein [Haloferax larsenii]UVE50781.1 hypothetical protein KU306_02510 [Haloferax larsenii]
MKRRTFIRGAGVTTGLAVGGIGSMSLDDGPVQESEAIAPIVIGAAALGGAVVLGWALREFEVIGSDAPADGLTASALETECYNTAQARESNNKSTFIDNQNILIGIEDAAYGDGKIAAIEAINNGETESATLDAATAAVDAYETTVVGNFLKSWNESVNEFYSVLTACENHGSVAKDDFFKIATTSGYSTWNNWNDSTTTAYTHADGTTLQVQNIEFSADGWDLSGGEWTGTGGTAHWSPVEFIHDDTSDNPDDVRVDVLADAADFDYLHYETWSTLLNDLETAFQNVRTGLGTWVSNIYGQVQSGELDTTDLLTSSELAALKSDDADFNQAIADLMALNIAVEMEKEVEVYLPNIGATLYGDLGVTGETTLSTGTVDPTSDSYSYYLTYDVSLGQGTWDAYNSGIDGGVVTFTSEPFEATEYLIHTTAGETATVTADDFTDNGDSTWDADLSAQLDTAITNVDSIDYEATVDETQYETVLLDQPFEIVTFRDPEGNESSSADYTKTQPHDDTNYITKEEWQAREDRYLELIEMYEESQPSGGGGGLIDGSLSGTDTGIMAALAAVAIYLLGSN